MCEIAGEKAVRPRELSLVFCDDLEGQEGGSGGRGCVYMYRYINVCE